MFQKKKNDGTWSKPIVPMDDVVEVIGLLIDPAGTNQLQVLMKVGMLLMRYAEAKKNSKLTKVLEGEIETAGELIKI